MKKRTIFKKIQGAIEALEALDPSVPKRMINRKRLI